MAREQEGFRTHGAEVVAGTPCEHGHAIRYKNGGGCVECHLIWAAEQRVRVKKNGLTALAEANRTIRALRKEIRELTNGQR